MANTTPTLLPERVSGITEIWRRLASSGWSPSAAHQLFERLRGLLAASQDGNASQIVESALAARAYLCPFVDGHLAPSPGQVVELGHLFESLVAAAESLNRRTGVAFKPVMGAASGGDAVYWFGADTRFRESLSDLLNSEGQALESFDTASGLLAMLEHSAPGALVIDTMSLDTEHASLGELAEAVKSRLSDSPPCLVIGHSSDLSLRLEAMRAGADAFFVAPVTPEQVRDRIRLVTERNRPERYRILVAEDDPAQADFAVKLLTKAGMESVAVTQPLNVIETLESFRPDLILMDLYMPEVSGTELTAIIREHDEFSNVPIVFLSGELDEDKQFRALTVGGDDFLSKPIRPKHLIDTVRHRIERTRAMQRRLGILSAQDPVTKLFNRRHFIQVLDQALRNRASFPRGSALLFVEVDEPERIHEQVGIGGADEVVARLGALVASVRQSGDTASRFGDYTLCIFVRRGQKAQVLELASQLQAVVTRHLFQVNDAAIKITLSIGIAYYGFDTPDSSSLIARSERACAEASRLGGARVAEFIPRKDEGDVGRKLEFMLLEAIEKGGFNVLYQPVISLRGLKGNRYQLQLRLDDEGTHIGEDHFRPLAEEKGLSSAIDDFVIGRALEAIGEQSRLGKHMIFMLSLSAAALESDAWAIALAKRLSDLHISTRTLVLEFAFEAVQARLGKAIALLSLLRRLGFTTGLSNFGADTLSFNILDELPAIYLRLSPAALDLDKTRLTETIDAVHNKKRVVIASGVNDARSVHALWACGADYLQGDFVQPPQETPDFENYESLPL